MVVTMSTFEEKQRIGQKIHTARKNKKITQLQLGKMLSVTKKAISDYELAKINVIPFEKRVQLSILLDIDVKDLLYEHEKENVSIGNDAMSKAAYVAFKEAKIRAMSEFVNSKNFGSLSEAIYKLGYLSQCDKNACEFQLDLENTGILYYEEFLKRGLSENDALELSKFFAWLSLKNPKVLSDWYDITLREKIAAGHEERK